MRTASRLWVFLFAAWLSAPALASGTIGIGYQRYGTLIVLKQRGTLEAALKPLGWSVDWTLFPSGPPLLEAMNAGAVDFGVTGETPPVFAQAAEAPIVYAGAEPPAPVGEAIVVAQASPITSVAQLKGKRVAYTRGSNGNYLLLRALQGAGLRWSDIVPVNLPPSDGPAAFQQGAVDAWAVWDPYLSVAETGLGARVLVDGSGLVPNRAFLMATQRFAQHHPDVLAVVLDAIRSNDAWSRTHQAQVSDLLTASSGLARPAVERAVARLAFGLEPMTPAVVSGQQRVADTLSSAGLIPAPVRVADDVPAPGAR